MLAPALRLATCVPFGRASNALHRALQGSSLKLNIGLDGRASETIQNSGEPRQQ